MTSNPVILVVDDEERIRRILEVSLTGRGHAVLLAADGAEAIKKLDHSVDLVLTDLKMPELDGMGVLEHVRKSRPDVPVIVMTAFGTIESAVAAMKNGAYDYVTKPFDLDEVELLIQRALHATTLARENRYMREQDSPRLEEMIGKSAPMQALFEQIQRVAPSDSSVLVTGETGTGKELVARAIHSLSLRRERLFVAVNCAAIPRELLESEMFGHVRGAFTGASADREGCFELADGGTLFLDEIGDMAVALQAKILRTLEESTVARVGSNRVTRTDVRVIAATNQNIDEAIAKGTFREDLYYRLNVIELRLSPLRERIDDISLLAAHFLERLAARSGRSPLRIEPDAMHLFEGYAWPGNVRELRNLCERLTVLCPGDSISADVVLPLVEVLAGEEPPRDSADTLGETVIQAEIAAIERALAQASNNKPKAAKLLGISERSLWYRIKRYRDRLHS
ncbi:MAG: sigma-54-dependent transcriptional regulator [Planctomycetota bacterium]